MSEQKTWAVHGHGLIGQELERQISQPGVAERMGLHIMPLFYTRSSGTYVDDPNSPIEKDYTELPQPDVTFLALPSGGDGDHARDVIVQSLSSGGIAITAEKAALANHFKELQEVSDDFSRLGVRATVGGGTRLVPTMREFCRDPENVSELHLALNGTLTAIMSSIGPAQGAANAFSLGQAVDQAIKLGYAEPGASSPYDVIRSEAEGDVPKKTSILMNLSGLLGESPEVVSWNKFGFELSDSQIQNVLREARVRRFVVSIFNREFEYAPEADRIGGFDTNVNGWRVVGGFQHIERNPLLAPLGDLSGPGNGYVINLGPNGSDGKYSGNGPGAGPGPTVNAMLDDLLELSSTNK